MITSIVSILQSDATLAAILPGGVHRSQEISRQATAAAYDANRELRPCALVKQESATPWGPYEHSGRLYIVVWLYQRFGYDAIEQARQRIYTLLHRQQISPTGGGGCWDVSHVNDVLDQEDSTLGAAMTVSRYVATIRRV
jgi:hypothetical protein